MPIAGVLLLRVGMPIELGINGCEIDIPASLKRCALLERKLRSCDRRAYTYARTPHHAQWVGGSLSASHCSAEQAKWHFLGLANANKL
jgi:hypothetical protein